MIASEERLATAIPHLILDPAAPPARHIAVGAASPIPAAACWFVRKLGHDVRLSLLHKRSGNPFTEGSRELFDLAGQGRIDLFLLGGGQIDGIRFREEHSRPSAGGAGGCDQRAGRVAAGSVPPRHRAGAGDRPLRVPVRSRAHGSGSPCAIRARTKRPSAPKPGSTTTTTRSPRPRTRARPSWRCCAARCERRWRRPTHSSAPASGPANPRQGQGRTEPGAGAVAGGSNTARYSERGGCSSSQWNATGL